MSSPSKPESERSTTARRPSRGQAARQERDRTRQGPHARPEPTNDLATPGAGALPDAKGRTRPSTPAAGRAPRREQGCRAADQPATDRRVLSYSRSAIAKAKTLKPRLTALINR
jgi:hypothetical protein